MPSKYLRPPKEFRIYGNAIRQTVIENFLVPLANVKNGKVKKRKTLRQSCITKFFK